jgi:hypothetical protein
MRSTRCLVLSLNTLLIAEAIGGDLFVVPFKLLVIFTRV